MTVDSRLAYAADESMQQEIWMAISLGKYVLTFAETTSTSEEGVARFFDITRLAFLGMITAVCGGCAQEIGIVSSDRPCYVQSRATADSNPRPVAEMTVANVGRWCNVGYVAPPGSAVSAAIESPAAHGYVRVRRTALRIDAEYIPVTGYFGRDEFRVKFSVRPLPYVVEVNVVRPSTGPVTPSAGAGVPPDPIPVSSSDGPLKSRVSAPKP